MWNARLYDDKCSFVWKEGSGLVELLAPRPGGRFVAEFGGRGNVQRILAAMQNGLLCLHGRHIVSPWYFPSVAEYATVLERHGLEVRSVLLFDRPTPLEGEHGMRHWVDMF